MYSEDMWCCLVFHWSPGQEVKMRLTPVLFVLPFILGLGLTLRITDFINQFIINEDSNQRQLAEVLPSMNEHSSIMIISLVAYWSCSGSTSPCFRHCLGDVNNQQCSILRSNRGGRRGGGISLVLHWHQLRWGGLERSLSCKNSLT